jgi:mRNA-degrading endonuclease RelE of RelBE toxin-antitoxin system
MFKVFFAPRADKEFGKLPDKLKQSFYLEIKKLRENPFSYPQVRKIENTKFGYRLRIGRWRILFALFSKEKRIEIVDIFLKKGKEDYSRRRHLLR